MKFKIFLMILLLTFVTSISVQAGCVFDVGDGRGGRYFSVCPDGSDSTGESNQDDTWGIQPMQPWNNDSDRDTNKTQDCYYNQYNQYVCD